ncbi:MAG: hypothetical protein ACLUUJ_00395 [Acutalibacteraceae bacterium]
MLFGRFGFFFARRYAHGIPISGIFEGLHALLNIGDHALVVLLFFCFASNSA